MISWLWLFLPLFVGATLGALAMGLLKANGPSVDDALWHLERLYRYMVEGGYCVEFPAAGIIDNARRFLARWGEGEGV